MTESHRSDLSRARSLIQTALNSVPYCGDQCRVDRVEHWLAEAIGLIQGVYEATDKPPAERPQLIVLDNRCVTAWGIMPPVGASQKDEDGYPIVRADWLADRPLDSEGQMWADATVDKMVDEWQPIKEEAV